MATYKVRMIVHELSAVNLPESGVLLKSYNPFKQKEISHSYQLDQSISILRVVGWIFSSLFKF